MLHAGRLLSQAHAEPVRWSCRYCIAVVLVPLWHRTAVRYSSSQIFSSSVPSYLGVSDVSLKFFGIRVSRISRLKQGAPQSSSSSSEYEESRGSRLARDLLTLLCVMALCASCGSEWPRLARGYGSRRGLPRCLRGESSHHRGDLASCHWAVA